MTTLIPTRLVSAYTTSLKPDQFPDARVLILADRYVGGGDESGAGVCRLAPALLEMWDADVHVTQYHTHPAVRLRKDMRQPMTFSVMMFDLDFHSHAARPTSDDFDNLVRILAIIDQTPNVAYPTRGGARILYVIDPITDPAEFEGYYAALLDQLRAVFENAQSGYCLDLGTRDWTRLFRAPRVVRDGVSSFATVVRVFHDSVFNVKTLKPRRKPPLPERVMGTRVFTIGQDAYLARLLQEALPGCRDTMLFKAACHVLREYQPIDAERLLDTIRYRAVDVDFGGEIERVIASARKATGGAA